MLLVACGDDSKTGGGGAGEGGNGGTSNGASGGGGSTVASTATDDDKDGFTEEQDDCDDSDASIHPGVAEICDDGKDNDCDGGVDASEVDGDGDGFGPCAGDCDDANPAISPASPEVDGDNIDNNCDGTTDADFDGDGVTVEDGDCDDNDSTVYPGADELCFDAIDNDCDGFMDMAEPDGDADGYGPCNGDCNDNDPAINPGATEVGGDGIDNNCDFLIDSDADADGWTVQNGDCNDNNPNVNPSVFEICGNGVDDDCDNTIDTDCVSKCELAEIFQTSVGCVYYAVDANNDPIESYDSQPYAVVVSNVDDTDTANVEIQTRQAGVWTTIQSFMVPPNTLHQFDLPDRHVNYTNVNLAGAYRVVSNSPIIAYQFQPINGQTSFTSDASLLIPTSALDRFYYNVGWGEPSYGNAQLNIVVAEDNTQVTVTPSTATVAGGSIPALAAGVAYTFPTTYNAGDIIQLEAQGGGPTGLSGTYITGTKTLAVFSTHWCANIPQQVCCCDHLEEQLFGLQRWGKKHVASRHSVRSSGTPDAVNWHIIAAEANTTISFTAAAGVTGLPAGNQILNAGQVLGLTVSGTVANPGDFIINADKPILVMQYMSSSAMTNASTENAGDPFMTQAVPVEQFLSEYVVLIPANWVNDRLIITKRVGETVTLDGTMIPQASFIGVGNPVEYEVARVNANADGVHSLDGSAPFGVTVIGYDSYDSYGYPGGLNQQILNPMN